MRPTTAINDNVFDFQALLHPGTVFEHPKDVVSHPDLTLAEKRAILASWASDASAIASCPALRAPEGLKAPVSIDVHPRSAVRTGWPSAQPARGQAKSTLLHIAGSSGLKGVGAKGLPTGRYSNTSACEDSPKAMAGFFTRKRSAACGLKPYSFSDGAVASDAASLLRRSSRRDKGRDVRGPSSRASEPKLA